MKVNKISRRAFLLGLGAVSTAALLSACGGSASSSSAASGSAASGVPQLLAVTCSARWTRSRRTAP